MLYFLFAVFFTAGITLPIVQFILKGSVNPSFSKGLVLGANYEQSFYGATFDGEEETRVFQLHLVQFHLTFLTLNLCWSTERPDMEWKNPEEEH